uniref:Odorant binding protein 3 n=1 Tax=Cephus cinctus TaxID=211228 RepID=A0A1W6L1E7_CEPCN|nr:odorant binding protein 3 [Cephus cinctus]
MRQNRQNWNSKSMDYNNTSDTGNRMRNSTGNMNHRNSMNTRKMDNDQLHSYNNQKYDDRHDQACVIQCFFNKLDLVDQKGFPERMAVTNIMSQNVHDPELRDFIEESVVDCFRYLDMDMNKEKCQFSQNLLGCLADKGREKCDDWEDEQE